MPSGAIGGALGVVGSLFGAKDQADAVKSGEDSQERASLAAIASNEKALERSIGLRQPFIDFGSGASTQLTDRLANPTTRSDIVNNDRFSVLFDNAKRTINAQNAGRKGVISGQNETDLVNASLVIGNQLYQQDINNLLQSASLGSNAASGAANNVSSNALQTSNLLTDIGNTKAAGKIGRANAINSGINNALGIGAFALNGGFG